MIDFTERHVLVIGGTGKIGGTIAAMALSRDARVTGTGRSVDEQDLGQAWIGWRQVDVTDPGAVAKVMKELGDVTDVVLAAAAPTSGRLLDMGLDDLGDLVETRLLGAFHVARAAAKHLPDNGTLTFLSGLLASDPNTASPVAAVSAAVETLARALAVELAPMRVNVISPAAVGSAGRSGHAGRAEDIGHAVLLTIENPWISGAVIPLHGAGPA